MKLRLIRQPNTITVTIPDNEPFDLAQYGGSAVGAGNAIHVQPGTGALFNLGTIGDVATQTTLALIKAKTDNLDTALSTILTELGQKYEGGAISATVNTITGFATSANQLPDGHNVTVDNEIGSGVYVRPGTSAVWDVSDRAARLVGVVYGSQGAQLQQKVTSNDLIVTLDGESVAVTGTFWQATQPVSGTFWQATQPVSIASVPSHAVTNAGTFAVQASQATAASLNMTEASAADIKTAVQLIDNAISGSGFNITQQGGVAVSLNTGTRDSGTQRVTIATNDVVPVTDNSGSLTVDAPVATPVFVTPTPSTTGGWTSMLATSSDGATALTATAQVIKASAGTFGGYYIYNPNAAAIYVHIYNVAAASVTVGTTNPQLTFCIPAAQAANLEISNGVNFATAMSCAATTTGGGNTAPTTALEAVFLFK